MSAYTVEDLLKIMRRLRDPVDGCPWDLEQDFKTIAPYTIEEAYEVGDAIARNDMAGLRDELGDLLFQIVFHAQMAAETGHFSFGDVVASVCEKMLSRHPHVFGTATVADSDAQTLAWETHKARERAEKAQADGRTPSVLDGVALNYPALMRAVKLAKRAARVGFDWPDKGPVLEKIQEELLELSEELGLASDADANKEAIESEFGDVLFAYTNLARFLDIDPEKALRGANRRFEDRFRRIESILAGAGEEPQDKSLDELEELWQRAKRELLHESQTSDRA